jgi:hypothetical protein
LCCHGYPNMVGEEFAKAVDTCAHAIFFVIIHELFCEPINDREEHVLVRISSQKGGTSCFVARSKIITNRSLQIGIPFLFVSK